MTLVHVVCVVTHSSTHSSSKNNTSPDDLLYLPLFWRCCVVPLPYSLIRTCFNYLLRDWQCQRIWKGTRSICPSPILPNAYIQARNGSTFETFPFPRIYVKRHIASHKIWISGSALKTANNSWETWQIFRYSKMFDDVCFKEPNWSYVLCVIPACNPFVLCFGVWIMCNYSVQIKTYLHIFTYTVFRAQVCSRYCIVLWLYGPQANYVYKQAFLKTDMVQGHINIAMAEDK